MKPHLILTQAINLTLLGSMLILPGCGRTPEEEKKDKEGGGGGRSHYSGPRSHTVVPATGTRTSTPTPAPSPSGRGGFGSTGHGTIGA